MSRDLHHGGALDLMRERFPDVTAPWIDLSTGINPWPYPDTDITPESLANLPTEAECLACRDAMARAIGAPKEAVVLAPGSELLIRLLPEIINPRTVAVLSPTYGDHHAVWRRAGVEVIETANPLDLADDVEAIVICNPNNPDGRIFSLEALEETRAQLARRGGWLIVDEAYGDLNPAQSLASLGGSDGLIILRSFGKFFGLAGLRLGALIAPEDIRTTMMAHLGFWPVSGAALEIGIRAYADLDWQAKIRTELSEALARLKTLLLAGSLDPVGSTQLFHYAKVEDAHSVWQHLAQHGIYVRRFDWSDCHLRIGLPANPEEEARLAAALSLSV
ncbi:MAG: threonine-phosphate decarboxylase CobD [Pseudomonadota bacterium]